MTVIGDQLPLALIMPLGLLVTALVFATLLERARRRAAFLGEALQAAEQRADRAAQAAQAAQASGEIAEQAMRSSEARTKAILEAAVDGIITIDEEGRIRSFNHAAARIFQYKAAEVLGRNVNILMPEPYHSAHDLYLHNYLSTGEARIIGIGREVRGRRKDGSTFPMDLAVGESVLEGRRLFAGIVRDISERKSTEQRLEQSEENFRLLVEGVRDYAITLMDAEGRITNWNHGAERILGWTAEEALQGDFSIFFLPEDVAAGEPERILGLVRRDGAYEGQGTGRRKDGSSYWTHVTLTRLVDRHGSLRGYARIGRDMTEQRSYEEALRKAKEEAERANLAKSKFLAAASHDLRQPVQALVLFTSALSMKINDAPAANMLGELQNSLDGLNMLLESLLDISKLDAGVVTPQIDSFPLSTLLDRLAAEFAPQAENQRLRFRVVGSGEFVRSDPTLLARILRNLVANALRYTPSGGILVGARRDGGNLRLEVWDTGIGIPAGRREEIFEEFTQLANPERDRNQGLGLGLAIVRRLTRLLGHELTLRSAEGRGSVFSVRVPRASRRMMVPAEPLHARGEQRLVVIIDDEVSILKGLGLVLESWGFKVVAAASEEEALALLEARQLRPHAILADYRLRDGHTGTEAARHIRALFNEPIPSIIITGDTAPERLREAEASGFAILHKPVKPPHLHDLLVQSLRSTVH